MSAYDVTVGCVCTRDHLSGLNPGSCIKKNLQEIQDLSALSYRLEFTI